MGLLVPLGANVLSLSDARTAKAYRGRPPSAATSAQRRPADAVATAGKAGSAPRLYAADARRLLLLGSSGGFASSDAGATWTAIGNPPAPQVIADSGAGGRLLAAGPAIWSSSNAGQTWQRSATLPPLPGPYSALALSPTDPNVWFVLAQGRLLRTRDGGVSWRQGLTGLPATLDSPVMRAAAGKDSFLLASGTHVYLLTDNGQLVDDLGSVPDGPPITELAELGAGSYATRVADGHLYAGGPNHWSETRPAAGGALAALNGHLLAADARARLGGPADIELSADGGKTWTRAAGTPRDQSVEALAFAPDGTAVAYGYGGDIYESTDGGASWSRTGSGLRNG